MKYSTAILTTSLIFLVSCKAAEKLGLTEPTREPIQNQNPAACPNWLSDQIVDVNQSITLPENCNYDRVSFRIASSNISFDCNGATFNGLGKTQRNAFYVAYKTDEAPVSAAFNISTSENNFVQNVTIKNCSIQYYVNGINVNFGLNQDTHNDLKNGNNATALETYLRTVSPKNILVENTTIKSSHRTAIYINRYITDFKLSNSTLTDNDIGVYFESGTQNNEVLNSYFNKNGETTYDVDSRERKPRIRKREAIAIDSSAYNTISGNTFENNSGGGIFLYKNCYENHTDEDSLPRLQHSNFNTIKNNQFKDEEKGVWIASRQSRDTENQNCGDPLIFENEGKKYYEDFAKNNQVVNNTFLNGELGVVIEDDNNTVSGNTFSGGIDHDIVIGTEIRNSQLNRPVTGTIVENNTFNSNAEPHVLILYGSTNSTFNGNSPAVSIEESTR